MALSVRDRECLGLEEGGLTDSAFGPLRAQTSAALEQLQTAARAEGFDLQVASAFRSFERQRQIWNGKLGGRLPVLDDNDAALDLALLEPRQQIARVMRFSALPGASRHHWGTDVDVYDAAAMPAGYRLGLTLAEVAPDGIFGAFHEWLDARIESGRSFGFFRPYDRDRGGVSPERWHLSYAPVACELASHIDACTLRAAWGELTDRSDSSDAAEHSAEAAIALQDVVEAELETLLERFVLRVATPPRAALSYRP